MKLYVAAYKGQRVIPSQCIRKLTWRDESHVSLIDPVTGTEYEAWASGGEKKRILFWQFDQGAVLKTRFGQNHMDGTPVTLYEVEVTAEQKAKVIEFLEAQLGKPYDWKGVFRFISRPAGKDPMWQEEWFCSELVFAAFAYAGIYLLLRIEAWKVFPGLVVNSPVLKEAAKTLTHVRSESELAFSKHGFTDCNSLTEALA